MKKEKLRTKKSKEFLKYEFTHEEIHSKGIELARLSSELVTIDDERKAVAAEFKAKIETKQAEVNLLGNHINNGYEHRYIECTVTLNDPNTGIKTIRRDTDKSIVRKETMSPDEMQEELEFTD